MNNSGNFDSTISLAPRAATIPQAVSPAVPSAQISPQQKNPSADPKSTAASIPSASGQDNPLTKGADLFNEYVSKEGQTFSSINPQYQEYIKQEAAAANNPDIQNAYSAIAQLGEQYNNATAGINAMGGLDVTSASGLLGNLKNAYNNNLAALQGQLTNTLTKAGLSQTGFQQAGAAELAGAATAQAGYQTAAGLVAPQTPSYANALFYPGGGAGAFGTVGGGQYGTGPAAASNVASIQSLTGQVNTWSAARSQASTIVSQQLTPLLNTAGVNPNDLNAINDFLQQVAGQTSNPYYAQFQNMIADLASVYAQILTPSNGRITDLKTQISQGLLSAAMAGKGLSQVIAGLDSQAQSKISGTQDTIKTLQMGGNPNTPTGNGTIGAGGGTGSAGGGGAADSYSAVFGG